ncbi:MAG: hypothetical protein KAU94_03060 [Verrucomicrobia bacterium]|nr:hypothetical protein [Verrucomicrobiota bacterium]
MAEKRFNLVAAWVVAFGAVLTIALLRHPKSGNPPSVGSAEAVSLSRSDPLPSSGKDSVSNAIASAVFEDPVSEEKAEKVSVLISTNKLRELLPDWMDYEGVDLHQEQITVAGRMATRVRGRFEWSNGSLMEMEVTDLGIDPDETMLKSLGFNADIVGAEPEAGSPRLMEVPHSVVSQEYNEEAMEGTLQLLVGNRFLVEVQLEKLPFESFQTVIDFQVPMQVLIDLSAGISPKGWCRNPTASRSEGKGILIKGSHK